MGGERLKIPLTDVNNKIIDSIFISSIIPDAPKIRPPVFSIMEIKDRFIVLCQTLDDKFKEQFGFKFNETTFTKVVKYLHAPKYIPSLAVTRILFGYTMLFDIPDERGGSLMHKRWGEPKMCHFPLFDFIQAVPMPYMALVYAALWIGALGIALGYKYRITAPLFTICYWYLFLIEKSFWNNHSYLFGLVSLLLACTNAHCYWSVDACIDPEKLSHTVPYWNYFILKYQFFILYFMAGVKKGTAEWLTGYSVPNLSSHWVFSPFTLFLTVEQTDYIIVHWFIFLFDLTVAFWMMWSRSRHVAMFFCALFHLMNSRLFTIGMFPWVCLATMPLFYPFDWPILLVKYMISLWTTLTNNVFKQVSNSTLKTDYTVEKYTDEDIDEHDEVFEKDDNVGKSSKTCYKNEDKDTIPDSKHELIKFKDTFNEKSLIVKDLTRLNDDCSGEDKTCNHDRVNCRQKITTVLIIIYVTIQLFLPFSHFITKGYNNWTNGLYGYSWDMMVHTWDVQSVTVKVVDNENNGYFYVDPEAFTPNDRWSKHGDMVLQYAKCLKKHFIEESHNKQSKRGMLSQNISIYIDVWCSMNGRFVQRMFDSRVDLLQASWSPFQKVPYLMPLLDEASEWRSTLDRIRSEVHSWDQHSDVIFFADFPGYHLEKYIPPELTNITLTVLRGQVVFEPEVTTHQNGYSYKLKTGYGIKLDPGMFHRVLNIGKETAFYMYTFYNSTALSKKNTKMEPKPKLPVTYELGRRFRNMFIFANIVFGAIYQVFFQLSMFLV